MPEASPAHGTLKRLIEAEAQARGILKAAEERAEQTVAQARAEAAQSVEEVRQETASLLHSRLAEAQSEGTAVMKQRMDQAEAEIREIERRAETHFSAAVDMVVDWVINNSA